MQTPEDLRVRALEMAVGLYDQRENTDAIVTRAKAFYDFLQDGKTVTT